MAQLTPRDDDTAESGDDITAPSGGPPAKGGEGGPVGDRADVAARRAATKARMDEQTGTGKGAASKASADDPTGAKARKAARKEASGSSKAATSGKASADDPTGAKARKAASTSTKSKIPKPSKRTGATVDPKAARAASRSGNPKKAAEAAAASRYTAPIPRSQIESPPWVAGLMFALIAIGMIILILTYVLWEGRPLALGAGLGCILAAILTGTRVR